jgi:hypothetical protein
MGCDIHFYREKREDGKWVTADEWNADGYVDWEKRFTDRNYNLFAILAGVRVREEPPYQFEPRGLPLGMCPELERASADEDGHSASYLYLHEIKELRKFLAAQTQTVSGMKNVDELAALNASIASGSPDWDLLYPYCQGTNDPKQVKFSVDVPADFIVGPALDEIIASLSDIGGDLQRAVFWFDN